MNAAEPLFLPDIQSSANNRTIAIQRFGIGSVVHPVTVMTGSGVPASSAPRDRAEGPQAS